VASGHDAVQRIPLADFLRRRIKRKLVKRLQPCDREELQLARSADAGYLPGWCGPVPEG
jgi:hypothetical protein